MAVVNVTTESHAAAKQAAERAGMSLGAWASRALEEVSLPEQEQRSRILNGFEEMIPPRLAAMALERSQSPSETLSAALDALASVAKETVPFGPEQADAFWALCSEEGKNPESMMAKLIARWKSPTGIQPPKPAPDRGCGCDGPEEPGPHHKPSCGRRT